MFTASYIVQVLKDLIVRCGKLVVQTAQFGGMPCRLFVASSQPEWAAILACGSCIWAWLLFCRLPPDTGKLLQVRLGCHIPAASCSHTFMCSMLSSNLAFDGPDDRQMPSTYS